MIAALFVATGGCYFGLPDVDPWDKERDARKYAGPWPVVAHPPCERWGRYWGGGPMHHGNSTQKALGDDDGCFASALASVCRWGGVLEHPEASHAWRHFGLTIPKWRAGWAWVPGPRMPDLMGAAWTCCVAQGNYGHRSRKLTWLLFVGHAPPPELDWSIPTPRKRLDPGFHSREERAAAPAERRLIRRLPAPERSATPVAFRGMLLDLARASQPTQNARAAH
jgi:hypothetical protein